jgi:hypothetical protein
MPFVSRSIRLAGDIVIAGHVAGVFPLFSPLGELDWVPGWEPEILHPPGASWERGMIFRTREAKGEAIWIVSRLDRDARDVEYHRVEPGRYVARVTVRCAPAGDRSTVASVAYEFVGLSDAGNDEIAAMTEAAYAGKLARWRGWIEAYLVSGGA